MNRRMKGDIAFRDDFNRLRRFIEAILMNHGSAGHPGFDFTSVIPSWAGGVVKALSLPVH